MEEPDIYIYISLASVLQCDLKYFNNIYTGVLAVKRLRHRRNYLVVDGGQLLALVHTLVGLSIFFPARTPVCNQGLLQQVETS